VLNLPVDQIIRHFNSIFYNLINDSEKSKLIVFQIFSAFDPKIELNGLQKIHEYFSLFSNKFNEFIIMFQDNYTHHFGCEVDYSNGYGLYQITEDFFVYLKEYLETLI
jgi:hypothetical protein